MAYDASLGKKFLVMHIPYGIFHVAFKSKEALKETQFIIYMTHICYQTLKHMSVARHLVYSH